MRIIGLYGHSGCGKSPTMYHLKRLLRKASGSSEPRPDSEAPETFEYKGMIICVAPGGDNEQVMMENVKYFEEKKCHIAFSSCRCKGKPVEVLDRFAKSQGVGVEWVPKSYEYNLSDATKEQCNKETAQFLLEMI